MEGSAPTVQATSIGETGTSRQGEKEEEKVANVRPKTGRNTPPSSHSGAKKSSLILQSSQSNLEELSACGSILDSSRKNDSVR